MPPPDPSRRLTLPASLAFAAPSLPVWALGTAVAVYLPPYFAGALGVPLTVIGAVWMMVRLFDIPVDVGLAMAMDRTRTPLGRYRVWLLAGTPVLMAALWALFMAPKGFSGVYLAAWLLVYYLGTSIIGLAHLAWAARLAPQYHDRSRLFGLFTALGVCGTLLVLAVNVAASGGAGGGTTGVRAMGWFLILSLPAAVALAATLTPETIAPEPPGRRLRMADTVEVLTRPDLLRLFFAQMALTLGPGWMSAIYLFFFEKAWLFTAQQATILLGIYILAQIPGAALTAALARRIGKHRALMVATTGFSLGLFVIPFVPKGHMLLATPGMIWAGLNASGFDLMIRAMLADVGDDVRLGQGKERTSLIYAVNGLASKIAAALSIGLSFPLLAALGFHPAEGAANTPAALRNLEYAFLGGPIVFVLLGGACVIGWRLDAARHQAIRESLEARDALLTAEPGAAAAIPSGALEAEASG